MQKKIKYYTNHLNNSDYPYGLSSSKNNHENTEENESENNTYQNPFEKYLIQNNQKMQEYFDINSSQEEINSKEDIIETKNEDEIRHSSKGKFKYGNNKSSQEDKNKKNPNKITNNICIIINKPEVEDTVKNKTLNFETPHIYGKKEKKIQNDKKSKHKNRNVPINKRKNNSYILKSKHKPLDDISNYNNYSYINNSEQNIKGTKTTLHKKLKQNQRKLKDLEQTIFHKELSLKKSKANLKENKNAKNTPFNSEKRSYKNKNNLKEDSITYESSRNRSEKKRNPKINFIEYKSINSEDRMFNGIPMLRFDNNKFYDEEFNIYKTMSPDISNDKYNLSFNKSIEQKKKLLGIPLYEYHDIDKDEVNKDHNKNFNITEKYKNRQYIIGDNHTKKNNMNNISKDNIKNKYKAKTPIRIIYNDNYNLYLKTNGHKNNQIKKKEIYKKQKGMNNNKSYITKKPYDKIKNKRIFNSQNNIYDYNISNKKGSYIQKKIKVYKQKEKPKENIKIIRKDKNRRSRESKESIIILPNNEILKDQKEYNNNTYYSTLIKNLFNFKDKSHKKTKKITKNTSDNRKTNNYNNFNANSNYYSNKKKNLYINNIHDISPFKTTKILTSPKNNDVLTVQKNEEGNTLRIIKKRNKIPYYISAITQNTQPFKVETIIQRQSKNTFSKKKKPKKEKSIKTKAKKEYKNSATIPSRGIAALRRINQKIENYKKRIPSKRRRRTKAKNPHYKSLSQLKKFGKHPFGKVKQNKSIKTLPDVNKDAFKNFDFIDDL